MINWSEKYLKEKLPHDGLGFLNTVTMDKLKTYGEMCRLEGEMYQASMSKGRAIDKTEEKLCEMEWIRLGKILTRIAKENNLK